MAHYAFIDHDNIVTHVIPGQDELVSGVDWETFYASQMHQRCLRTSYNTFRGEHMDGGTPFRYNYASPGYIYNEELDSFIEPKPYPSWVFDQSRMYWSPPIDVPNNEYFYWKEHTKEWVVFEQKPENIKDLAKVIETKQNLNYGII